MEYGEIEEVWKERIERRNQIKDAINSTKL